MLIIKIPKKKRLNAIIYKMLSYISMRFSTTYLTTLLLKITITFVFFLLYKGSNDIHNLENTIVYCTELIDTVKMILDFELKIGVSLYHQGMDAISVAYEEAKKSFAKYVLFWT